jgi:hypothetical protein
MRILDKREKVSRRDFLATGGAITVGVGAGMVSCPKGAWAVSVKNLKPETMQTLIQMARDIYPHDRLADKYYAGAVAGYDDQAGEDKDLLHLLEDGVATLDTMAASQHGGRYVAVGWESDRVALLQQIQGGPFFQKIRSGLVTGIYANPEVWPLFGYEGPSANKGGYIDRGFDDIDWL